MINVVHTKQGRSFVGLCAYLLEGSKGNENPERVDWTQTLNLSTSRPMTAARVMAACAMDQARLKQNAGISNTGRKSKNHVLHYTLSWQPGTKPSREEMMEAVHGSIAVLGEKAGQKGGRKGKKGRVATRDQFASEHQVLVVAHNDSPKDVPHCHVVINRVHPEHGIMLPSSNDYLRLSKWAEKFERDHGGLVVDQRAVNNEARDEGQKVYGAKRKPRDVYELEQHARDNHPEALKLQAEQGAKDAKHVRESEETSARCRQEWRTLEATHRERLRDLDENTAKQINTETLAIQTDFAPKRRDLHLRQKLDVEAFEKKENTLLGQASNALKQLASLQSPVNVLWSQGARIEAFEKKQRREKLELEREERKAKREAKARLQRQRQTKKIEIGQLYLIERAETILRHQVEKAKVRAAWKTRIAERENAWDEHHKRMAMRPPEKSFGRQTTVADERTRDVVKSYEKLQERRAAKAKERDRAGRGDRGR